MRVCVKIWFANWDRWASQEKKAMPSLHRDLWRFMCFAEIEMMSLWLAHPWLGKRGFSISNHIVQSVGSSWWAWWIQNSYVYYHIHIPPFSSNFYIRFIQGGLHRQALLTPPPIGVLQYCSINIEPFILQMLSSIVGLSLWLHSSCPLAKILCCAHYIIAMGDPHLTHPKPTLVLPEHVFEHG